MLNQSFISVKVDREERPDIDAVYMNVCQALTGSGGWPLTIIMTPDKKSFFAGTYFPKHSKYGHLGLMELLEQIAEKWRSEKTALIQSGDHIVREIKKWNQSAYQTETTLNEDCVEHAITLLKKSFDRKYGGFGTAPKFPSPHNLLFLLNCYGLGLGEELLEMVETTLDSMYRGGIFDHVGYGFSRYATDKQWLIPHFEKMLYDNALLIIVYAEAYQITKKPLYRYIAEAALQFIEREMSHEDGGFYSAQDADSEGIEGKYYTWDYEEIINLLGEQDGRWFCEKYQITKEGNFEGKNIINKLNSYNLDIPDRKTESLLEILRAARSKRFPLLTDDKVLTSWNAMMITAYTKAGVILNHPEYIETAKKALNFINDHMSEDNRKLKVSYRNGMAGGIGSLDDYAYLSWACLELYECTGNPEYLQQAIALLKETENQFSDESGGFFLSSTASEALIFRPKEFYDGAIPSGNSVTAYCIIKISRLTGDPYWEALAQKQFKYFSPIFNHQPTACTFALKALVQELYPSQELICIVPDEELLPALRQALAELYLPQLTVHIITDKNRAALEKLVPYLQGYMASDNRKAAFYLCHNKSCDTPVYEIQHLIEKIKNSQ